MDNVFYMLKAEKINRRATYISEVRVYGQCVLYEGNDIMTADYILYFTNSLSFSSVGPIASSRNIQKLRVIRGANGQITFQGLLPGMIVLSVIFKNQ